MPSISKDQQVLCQLAQLARALQYKAPAEQILKILTQIDDVNFKILTDKSDDDPLTGGTSLHLAGLHKHNDAFEALLARGADFTAKNKNGRTALHQAFCSMIPRENKAENLEVAGTLKNEIVKLALKAHLDSANTENPRTADGLSHFHIACAFDHLDVVRLFLNGKVYVNESVNFDSSRLAGYTPLHFAVRFCAYETAKLLLENGADVNAKEAEGLTPLHLVVERNWRLIQLSNDECNKEKYAQYRKENEKIIRLLLEDNRVLKVDETGFSKLHAASILSDSSFAEQFLRDIDVNCALNLDLKICPGYTPLHFAVRFNIETFKSLLRKGANIEAEDLHGVTAFDICVIRHKLEDLHDILAAIPDFEKILFSDGKTRLSDFVRALQSLPALKLFFQSTPKDIYLPKNCPFWSGYHLSHLAVLFSKPNPDRIHFYEIANFCVAGTYLDFDDSALVQDTLGRTPLHLAYYRQNEQIVDLLFRYQLGQVDIVDDNGLSHLHIACDRKNESVVRILLSMGANANRVYKGKTITSRLTSGSTPLHVAVEQKNVEIVKILLEHGADAYLIDAKGMTPMLRFTFVHPYLESRARKASMEISDLLLKSCDLKNVVCKDTGLSHLHLASLTGNKSAIEVLLELGADPNAVFMCKKYSYLINRAYYSSGHTPLHFAVENKDTRVIELLVRGGADILHKKTNGMTLLYDILRPPEDIFGDHSLDINITKIFVSIFANDEALRRRAKEDCGLTLLHIACFLRDVERIRSSLTDPLVDVNAQIHSNSPIWPGLTPLHLWIEPGHNIKDLENIAKMLLDFGAKVTLMNNEGDTPVHKAWIVNRENDFRCEHLLHLLLRYQTDFSVNPVNVEGISHFHLACAVSEHTIAKKFLENGVDVNLPIDYLHKSMSFQTPLKFMLSTRQLFKVDTESHLRTIDILLKYGADTNVQDENGSNPFLEVAKFGPSSIIFLKKLSKSGVNVECRNMHGQTAFEIFFNACVDITIEDVQFFFKNHNLLNSFNSVSGKGLISKIIEKEHKKFILNAVIEHPNFFTVDEMGRTPIHNIVSNHVSAISAVEYADYIERFIKMGFDIDAQETTGKTALHLAAYFRNEKAIRGLLIAGADINITDVISNETLLTKLPNLHARWSSIVFTNNGDNHYLKSIVALHLITLQQCGLEVNSENVTLATEKLSESELQLHRQTVSKELEDAKSVKIGRGSLTLRDFLSETGAVASRPSMICDEGEAVDKFFTSIDYKRFPVLGCLIKLQYRKMLKRLSLMEDATDSLREIIGDVNGFPLPEICLRMIIRFLTTTEVKYLIACASIKI